MTESGVLVLAGAIGRAAASPAMPSGYRKLREGLIDRGVLRQEPDRVILTEDVQFGSPSAAAAVLLGTSVAGPEVWKDRLGRSLGTILADRDKSAG